MADGTPHPVPLTGRCLCKAVTITLEAAKPLLDVCHCSMCRQWGGPYVGVSAESYTVAGEEHVTAFRSSDLAARAFCSRCGSNLWFDFLPGDHRSFLAGLFELPDSFFIHQQIFIDEKPGWYDLTPHGTCKTGAEIIAEARAAGFDFA